MADTSPDGTLGKAAGAEHTTGSRPAQATGLYGSAPPRRIWSRAYLMQDVNPDLSTIPLTAYCFMTGWVCVFAPPARGDRER
jgi:hypothetical protein